MNLCACQIWSEAGALRQQPFGHTLFTSLFLLCNNNLGSDNADLVSSAVSNNTVIPFGSLSLPFMLRKCVTQQQKGLVNMKRGWE